MIAKRLGYVEARFADIVWENAPLTSPELVQLCNEALGWKKSTTYTVLKKLCERGLFENDRGTVRALVTREEYYSAQSAQFVDETFDGSLPAFLAAFTAKKPLSAADLEELQRLIDSFREGG